MMPGDFGRLVLRADALWPRRWPRALRMLLTAVALGTAAFAGVLALALGFLLFASVVAP